MKLRQLIASLVALTMIGFGVVTLALPASATVSECVPSEAWSEVVTDTPATTVHHEATTHLEYVFRKWNWKNPLDKELKTLENMGNTAYGAWDMDRHPGPRQTTDKNWNAAGNPKSAGWGLFDTVSITDDAWDEPVPAVTHTVTHKAVTCTERVRWIVPASAGDPTNQAGQQQTFPQDRLVGALSCGRWSQDDTYVLHNAADKALFDSLGNTLTWVGGHPEDSAIYQSHTFTYGGDCATPVAAELNLTYMTACAPDSTNTWRIRNSSDFAVHYRLFYAGVDEPVATGTAQPGDTFVDLDRVQATAILKWGGGESGIIAGQKTKASGNDENCGVALGTPEVTPQTCTPTETGQSITGASVTLPPDIKGITYTIEGGEVSGLAPGTYAVTATPRGNANLTPSDGWTLNDDGTATYTVTITAAENCAVQPVPRVTYTEWAEGTYGCDDTTVVLTRSVITTPWILVDNVWILDGKNVTTVTQTMTRDLLPNERTVCPASLLGDPPAPTIVPPTCAADGSASLVNGEHYTWSQTSFGPGEWTATATAAAGYTFEKGTTFEAKFTVAPKLTGAVCPVANVLAAPPNATVTPRTFSQVLAAAPNASTASVLAATGATPLPLAIIAMVLIGAGVVLQPRVRRAIFTRH